MFLREKRLQKEISLRELAKKLDVSHSYLSYVEHGIKPPPNDNHLLKIADALTLEPESKRLLFDIAAETKQLCNGNYQVPADISNYLQNTEEAKNFIRKADELGYSNEFWKELLLELKKRNISQ